jgi:hypothetical protein
MRDLMFTIIPCLVLTYLTVVIFYNWKQYSLKNLWNIRVLLIVIFNIIVFIISGTLVLKLTHFVFWANYIFYIVPGTDIGIPFSGAVILIGFVILV